MEVIGAIASFMAIGRILQAIPSIVNTLRSLPEMKQEFMSLVNELETLRATHAEIESLVGGLDTSSLPLSAADSSRLWASKLELEGLLSDLKEFCNKSVSSAVKVNKVRFNPFRWLWGRKKAGQLRDRARGVRLDLQLSMAALTMRCQQKQTKLLLEIREVSYSSSKQIASGIDGFQELLQAERAKGARKRPLPSIPTNVSTARTYVEPGSSYSGPRTVWKESTEHKRISQEVSSLDDCLSVMTTLYSQCHSSCRCRCHSSPKKATSPSWFKPLLGSLMLSYNTTPVIRTGQCNISACRHSSASSSLISLTYHFPSWLGGYCSSVKAAIESSLTGYGAYIHATVPRLMPPDDAAWYHLVNKDNISLTCRYFRERAFLPTDEIDPGYSLLSAAIVWAEPAVLMALLRFWTPILRRTGISETETTLANRLLVCTNPKSNITLHSAITTVLSFHPESAASIPITPNDPFPPLHRAVMSNNLPQIQHLLAHNHQRPSLLESRDFTSWTPIHHAAFQGHTSALRLLLSSSSPSYRRSIINIRTSTNDTPLHCAVASRSLPCVQILLDQSADPTIQNSFGNMAIQLLITEDNSEIFTTQTHLEIIRLLLLKSNPGTTAMRKTRQGKSVVHSLVSNPFLSDQVFDQLLDLFLAAGAAAKKEVSSLLCYAVQRGNRPARLERLITKGQARMDMLSAEGENILHVAARWADLEVLEYLLEKVVHEGNISGVDVNLVVRNHLGSPWDTMRYYMTCSEINLHNGRRPSREEAHVFARLFCEVRDSNLKMEVQNLRFVMEALARRNGEEALKRLAELVQWNKQKSETYRVVGIQIKEGMWEAAVECLEENVELCLEEMRVSPWRMRSCWDCLQGEHEMEGYYYAGLSEQYELMLGGGKGCPLRNSNWRRKKALARKGLEGRRVVVKLVRSGKLRRGWSKSGVVIVPKRR
ncbi:hypothetical protein QBC43DRAFT_326078 [Cladorrhinum sp. PSN259]|nr:hypothetical protein QBC43DRAFT_326078 [Cladorrhinum sp. PSN259]